MSTEITKQDLAHLILDEELSIENARSIIKEELDIDIPSNVTKDQLVDLAWDHYVSKKDEPAIITRSKPRELDPKMNRRGFIELLIKEGGYQKTEIVNEVHEVFNKNEINKVKARRRVNKVVDLLKAEGKVKMNDDRTLEWIEGI